MRKKTDTSRARTNGSKKGLIGSSILYLLTASTGARVAIDEDIRVQFLGKCSENMPQEDFVRGLGTALSPGVKMLVAQMAATLLAGRSGIAGKAGALLLTLLGAVAMFGMLGEAVTYQSLNPKTFDPPRATIVIANIVLPLLMVLFGRRELAGERR